MTESSASEDGEMGGATRAIGADIWPVILSGGSGTRLWPLSRTERPKQMLTLGQDQPMILATAARAVGAGYHDPIVVAGEAHQELVEKAFEGAPLSALILEPAARNTAPAIAMAAHHVAAADPEGQILVMPSDHLIRDEAAFRRAVDSARELAADGWLVTFGIQPDHPETGYGYIEAGEPLGAAGRRVANFREKPDRETAEGFLKSGGFYWNAGIFLMKARAYLDALAAHEPRIASACVEAFEASGAAGKVVRPGYDAFFRCASQSIDYAVMEPAEKKAVVPVDMGWSDIGSFAALHEVLAQDEDGNVAVGDALVEDCRGSLLWSDGPLIGAVGLDNLVVVAAEDCVVVLPRERAQDVKAIVEKLKAAGRSETERVTPR